MVGVAGNHSCIMHVYLPYQRPGLPATVSYGSRGVGRPGYEMSLPQLEFLHNTMRFTWSQIKGMLLVSNSAYIFVQTNVAVN